jgi:DNA-binding NarL/FixJ family response regulator
MSIDKALLKMGYTEFVVRGDTYEGIKWVKQPDSIPSKEEVLDIVNKLDALEQAEVDAKATARESAIAKLSALGLTEEEIDAIKN